MLRVEFRISVEDLGCRSDARGLYGGGTVYFYVTTHDDRFIFTYATHDFNEQLMSFTYTTHDPF